MLSFIETKEKLFNYLTGKSGLTKDLLDSVCDLVDDYVIDHIDKSKEYVKVEIESENIPSIYIEKNFKDMIESIDRFTSLIYYRLDEEYSGYEVFSTITYILGCEWFVDPEYKF